MVTNKAILTVLVEEYIKYLDKAFELEKAKFNPKADIEYAKAHAVKDLAQAFGYAPHDFKKVYRKLQKM